MLHLNKDESQLLVAQGWEMRKTSDGPEFWRDVGDRSLQMGPVLKRNIQPMTFRPQACIYDPAYSAIAEALGWGPKWVAVPPPDISGFQVDAFDAAFAQTLTTRLVDWARDADLKEPIRALCARTQRDTVNLGDLINLTYLGERAKLEKIAADVATGQTDHLRLDQDPDWLLAQCLALVAP